MAEARPKTANHVYDPVPGEAQEVPRMNGRVANSEEEEPSQGLMDTEDQPLDDDNKKKRRKCPATWKVGVGLMLACALFVSGLLVGYYIRHLNDGKEDNYGGGSRRYDSGCGPGYVQTALLQEDPRNLESRHENLMFSMSGDKMGSYLWNFTDHMVYSGSASDLSQVGVIKSFFKRFGLISDEIPPFTEEYEVLLSFPNPYSPNTVDILGQENQVLHKAKIPRWLDSYDPFGGFGFRRRRKRSTYDDLQPFVAYSPEGGVQAEVVNLNYGRAQDLDVALKHSVLLDGRIALVKLGKSSVKDKVAVAEAHGIAGMLLFMDPVDQADLDMACDEHVPFANANDGGIGDPLTVGYPAVEGTPRPAMSEMDLPKIPLQTISCADAVYLLSNLTGQRAPPSWSGGINITHHIGRKSDRQPAWTVKLQTRNKLVPKTIHNVFGTLPGTADPDHYVVVGASRNSFARGPESNIVGTSLLLEFARNLEMLSNRESWKPKRTIKLVSWGGGEFGNIGMTEFLEEYSKSLQGRVLAYIDLDVPVLGKYVVNVGSSTPGLTDIVYNVAGRIPNPDDQKLMLFDNWREKAAQDEDTSLPQLDDLYENSMRIREQPFAARLSAPTVHIQYIASSDLEVPKDQEKESASMSLLEAHHHFRFHTAVARINALLALSLVDAGIVQYNVSKSARKLLHSIESFEKIKMLPFHNATMRALVLQAGQLDHIAHTLEFFIMKRANFDDALERRLLNERLLQTEPLIEKAYASVMRLNELIQDIKYQQMKVPPGDIHKLVKGVNQETSSLILHMRAAEQVMKIEIS